MIWGPLVGAIIGYCTNYIAVKMLFRPLKPVYLFGRQLPFTPGIIPKGRERLARAIGGVVGNTLLTEDGLKKTLLSDEVKDNLRGSVDQLFEQKGDMELRDACLLAMDEEQYDAGRAVLQEKLTDVLTNRIANMNLGETISQQVLAAVRQKVSGSLIGMMLSGDMLDSFAQPIQEGVDSYLDTNAYALLYPQVAEFWSEAEQKNIQSLDGMLKEAGISVSDIVVHIYETVVVEKAAGLLRALDLGKIAEDKVMEMSPEELEDLVMSVMKKELGAVVNLGALVGFILGLLNLIF